MQLVFLPITIREAHPEDNVGLIALTSQSPMQGLISVRIDRHPDFFELLHLRGQASKVFIAIHGEQIIGSFSVTQKTVWIQGVEQTVYYLADLKVLPAYQGGSTAIRLVHVMYDYLKVQGADLLYCTTAEGNERVEPFFAGRLGIPAFQPLGRFSVFQIIPAPIRRKDEDVHQYVHHLSPELQLHQFYNQHYKKYQFAPVLTEEDLYATINLVIKKQDAVVAAMSLFDSHPVKQNVVIDMPAYLKVLVAMSKLSYRTFGGYRLPSIGEPIRTLHVKYAACASDHLPLLTMLLRVARDIAWRDNYHFVSWGLHQDDLLQGCIRRMPKITFTSLGLITSLKGSSLFSGIPYEDFSLS